MKNGICIYLQKDEKETLNNYCKVNKISVSKYIRKKLFDIKVKKEVRLKNEQ